MNTQKADLKKQLIDACITKQQHLINDFKIRIKELLQVDGLGNEEAYDNSQQASISQNVTEADALNQALIFATEEMAQLHKLEASPLIAYDRVAPGAVVKTDKRTFFVSASLEEVPLNNKTYIGLSTKSALYLAMHGLKKGDNFSFHGTTYRIIDIF